MLPAVSLTHRAAIRHQSIAIDGPSGSGKTTVARLIAAELGYLYVDTGAMYRAVALRLLRQGAPQPAESVRSVLGALHLHLAVNPELGHTQVLLDGVDVSDAIRGPQVTRFVSPVAADPLVRRSMVSLQQGLARLGPVVMEGRDIGSVVLPEASTKIYLTAPLGHRAWRRYRELRGQGRNSSHLAQYWELRRRDRYDRSRADSPLVLATGATTVDSARMTALEVARCIIELHRGGQACGRDGVVR